MAEEHKLIAERERGHAAQRILSEPIWLEAWTQWEQTVMRAWEQTGAQDTAAREALWMALQVGRKVKGHMESVLKTGEMADMQLREIAQHKERANGNGGNRRAAGGK